MRHFRSLNVFSKDIEIFQWFECAKTYIRYTSVTMLIYWIIKEKREMSQGICPLCGKFFSTRHYDPSDFEDDIFLVQVRGLGRGKGVEIIEKYSLLDGSNPELLDLISDRIAVIYDLLFEEVEDEEDYPTDHAPTEPLSPLDEELLIEDDEKVEDISDLDKDIIE